MKKSKKIYDFIENFQLNEENFLVFVQTIAQYFSDKFNVRTCQIKISQLPPSETCGGHVPPARYGYRVKKNFDKLAEKENPARIDECIEFREDVARQANKGRIIKLIAHEWMHFYDALFMWKELDISVADEKYRKLILQSHLYNQNYARVRSKYEDLQMFSIVDKLSAKEVVADDFAQDFLKEVLQKVVDEKLKKQIQKEIEKHDLQIDDYHKKLKQANVEEEFVVL